jgi:hypothetical protein
MYKKLISLFALLGFAAMLALAAFYVLLHRGILDPDKVANFLKFNPAFSGAVPAVSDIKIQTNFARLNAHKISLAALSSTFENGGGAIAEARNGILVASRQGQFYVVDPKSSPPGFKELSSRIDINQAGFEAYAKSKGYDIRAGIKVGYAGLGMRLHDLLLTDDGETLLASYTFWDDAKHCATLRVSLAAFSMSDTLPATGPWKQVFESKPCLELSGYKSRPFAGHQAGGRMVQRAADKILLTIGDFKNDGVKRDITVADANVNYGKIHEIDITTSTSRVFSSNRWRRGQCHC